MLHISVFILNVYLSNNFYSMLSEGAVCRYIEVNSVREGVYLLWRLGHAEDARRFLSVRKRTVNKFGIKLTVSLMMKCKIMTMTHIFSEQCSGMPQITVNVVLMNLSCHGSGGMLMVVCISG
jgi:hypothetical protein